MRLDRKKQRIFELARLGSVPLLSSANKVSRRATARSEIHKHKEQLRTCIYTQIQVDECLVPCYLPTMYHTPDEITHPLFLESPLNTLRASLDPSKPSIALSDIQGAYDTFYHRLSNFLDLHEGMNPPVELGTLPSAAPLKRHGEALVRGIARDTYNVTVDQYAHTTHHPEEDHSLDIDQYEVDPDYDHFAFQQETSRVELLCSICISALKITGLILMSDGLIASFSCQSYTNISTRSYAQTHQFQRTNSQFSLSRPS